MPGGGGSSGRISAPWLTCPTNSPTARRSTPSATANGISQASVTTTNAGRPPDRPARTAAPRRPACIRVRFQADQRAARASTPAAARPRGQGTRSSPARAGVVTATPSSSTNTIWAARSAGAACSRSRSSRYAPMASAANAPTFCLKSSQTRQRAGHDEPATAAADLVTREASIMANVASMPARTGAAPGRPARNPRRRHGQERQQRERPRRDPPRQAVQQQRPDHPHRRHQDADRHHRRAEQVKVQANR